MSSGTNDALPTSPSDDHTIAVLVKRLNRNGTADHSTRIDEPSSLSPRKSVGKAVGLGLVVLVMLYVVFPPQLIRILQLEKVENERVMAAVSKRAGHPVQDMGTADPADIGKAWKILGETKNNDIATSLWYLERPDASSLLDSVRLSHVAVIAVLGCLVLRRVVRSEIEGGSPLGGMWAALLVGTFCFGLAYLCEDPSLRVLWKISAFLASLVVLSIGSGTVAVPLPGDFRGVVEKPSEPDNAFGSLIYRRLPLFTLRKRALMVTHAEEFGFPSEKIGDHKRELMNCILWLLSEKQIDDMELWRCSPTSGERVLLLVERRIGFCKSVWCVVDVNQIGGGIDLHIKLHRLIPRHLDWQDYTLLRVASFPVAVGTCVLDVMSALSERSPQNLDAGFWLQNSSTALLLLAVVGGGILVFLSGGQAGIVFVVFGILLSFILHVLRANEPGTTVTRASDELMHTVQAAVVHSMTALQSVI